ncbi:MAG: hypothetical protein ACRENW_09495 [Thermodesulfobacteriota bacterium]
MMKEKREFMEKALYIMRQGPFMLAGDTLTREDGAYNQSRIAKETQA